MASSWQKLPEELQLDIFAYLDMEDIKAVRKVCKAYTGTSSSLLFHTIHISPNARSFDRAHNVAGVDRLATLVRSLVYHVNIMDGSFIEFEAFQNEVLRVKSRNILTMEGLRELEHQAETMHRAYLEEFDAQDEFQRRDEHQQLKNLLERFRNLESIGTHDEEGWSGEYPLKGYIERRTGVSPNFWFDGGREVPCVKLIKVAAQVRSPLRSVSAAGMDWKSLADISDVPSILEYLSRLAKLRICLSNADVDSETGKYLPLLTQILQACKDVEDLTLDFDEIPFERSPHRHMQISKAIHECTFPHLRQLRLNGLITFESSLASFVERCAPTLEELYLGDICLYHVDWEESFDLPMTVSASLGLEEGSIISLFWKIHDVCRLHKVELVGVFTNREDESWYVKPTTSSDCLRARFERFLCRKGSCPVGPLDEYLKLKGDRSYVEDEDILSLPASRFEDDSWEWSPELIQY